MSEHFANSRLLNKKLTKHVSRILQQYPNIGKDIEKYVSERRVGADQWRKTSVLPSIANAQRGTTVIFRSIKLSTF